MEHNLYVQHLYPPSHHLPQPQHQTYRDSYVSQPQPQPQHANQIPPPHRPVQAVAREPATFDRQHLYIEPHYQPDQHFATAAEEGGLTGWVPLEEQGGFQHQPTSVTPIAGKEALIGYSNLDQFQYPVQTATTSTTASFHPQPGRATTSYNSLANWNALPEQQQQQHLSGQPQANDNAFLECSIVYHQNQEQNVHSQAAFQGYADAWAQQHQSYELARPHAQTGNTVSQGQVYSPTSPSESLYQADMDQQTLLGSPESMAILDGAIPSQHQQHALPASSALIAPSQSSCEAEAQYHHQQQARTSAPVHSFQPGASDSASNFIITNSSTNVTVCVQPQQPQALAAAPTRTSSLAGWADVPPTEPAHREPVHCHHQQTQYHQQQVKVAVLEQAYAPQDVRSEVPIVEPRAINARAPIPNHPLPAPLRSSITTTHPRSQAQAQARPLGRSDTMPAHSEPVPSQPQQHALPASSSLIAPSQSLCEAEAQYPHQEQARTSAPVHSPQPGAFDSASNFIITNSLTNVTVCVQPQQPQAPAATPTRTSSLAGWADVPPTEPAHREPVHCHHQQAQYHQQQVKVEEVPVLEQAYAPQHVRSEVPIVELRAVNARAPIPNRPLPAPLRSATTTTHPRSQAQAQARPLGRSATMPDPSPSAPQQQQPSNRLSPSRIATELDVSVRHIEAIKASDHIRRAVELHVDVGNADLSSPASHKARVKARKQKRMEKSAPYLKDHLLKRSPSTFADDTQGHCHDNQPHHLVPSSIPAEQRTTGHFAPNKPLQHQKIGFSNPGDEGKDLAAERRAADAAAVAAAVMLVEKRPFLACAFCRQRKIACGQRAPHARDHELPDGPRTCNQCARRGLVCSYPNESRRGIRKAKPVAKIIVHPDGTEETIYVEEEEEEGDDKSRKKKGRGPIEWIIAVDAWLICPVAWAAHLAALELKKAEADAAAAAAAAVAEAAEAAAASLARKISPPHHPSRAEDYASAIPPPSQLARTAPV